MVFNKLTVLLTGVSLVVPIYDPCCPFDPPPDHCDERSTDDDCETPKPG